MYKTEYICSTRYTFTDGNDSWQGMLTREHFNIVELPGMVGNWSQGPPDSVEFMYLGPVRKTQKDAADDVIEEVKRLGIESYQGPVCSGMGRFDDSGLRAELRKIKAGG